MNSKKLFLTDLDGTLLTDAKDITPATMKALQEFVQAGNVFAISTGRGTENALYMQEHYSLAFPGSFVIAYNGAEIWDHDQQKVIYRTGIDLPVVEALLSMAEEMKVHVHTFNDRYIVSSRYDEEMVYYKRIIKTPVIITDDVLKELDKPPCKLIGVELHDFERIEAYRKAVDQRFGHLLTTTYSNPNYLEIFPREAGKGAALLRLCEYTGISVENAYAAGDAENDIPMILAAGTGIAMINGSAPIREAADVITKKDNNHDGLVPFLLRAAG